MIDTGLLASLLGGQAAQAAAPVAAEATPQDIAVTGSHLNSDPVGFGLVRHGRFSAGHTLGNILGTLGDAFLVQSGHDPVYSQRRQQMREANALENYSTDPEGALQQYQMVAPAKDALNAFNQYQDNVRQQTVADASIQNADFARKNKVRSVISSMLYSANPQTFPALLERAKAYASANGVDIDLPNDFESAKGWAMSSVPVGDQVTSENLKAYRDASIAQRAKADAIRAQYYNAGIGERSRHDRAMEDIGRTNAAAHSTSAAASKTRADKYQPGGKKGGDPIADALMKKYGLSK